MSYWVRHPMVARDQRGFQKGEVKLRKDWVKTFELEEPILSAVVCKAV